MSTIETIPARIYPTPVQTGDQEIGFFVRVRHDDSQTALPDRVEWQLSSDDNIATISGAFTVTDAQRARGRVYVAAMLPASWKSGHLSIDAEIGGQALHSAQPIVPYVQTDHYRLPLEAPALVVVGHRLGEAHRVAWDVPSQQFAWDFISLDPDGLRVLRPGLADPDLAADFVDYGRDVLACADGVVVRAVDGCPDAATLGVMPDVAWFLEDLTRAFGNYVIVKHAGDVYSMSVHLLEGSLKVTDGMQVKAGQPVGALGNSGFSTGPHLHFHFMDGPDPLSANPLPIHLDVDVETRAPQCGDIISE